MTETPPKRRKKRRKKKQPSQAATIYYSLADIWSQYEEFLKPVSIAFGIAVFVFLTLTWLNFDTKSEEEFYGRTTSKWLELEAQGKARRAEVLWQDQRWMPLEMALGLDWAAVPVLFDALLNEKTKRLAEATLGKYEQTTGAPRPNDILAGLKSEHDIVRLWAVKLASKLEQKTDLAIQILDELKASTDEQISAEAKRSLERLASKPTSQA